MASPRPKRLRFLKPVNQVASENQQADVAEVPPSLQPASCAVDAAAWSVVHSKTGIAHVWISGEKPLCREFTSGTPERPMSFAVFTKDCSSGIDFCDICKQRAEDIEICRDPQIWCEAVDNTAWGVQWDQADTSSPSEHRMSAGGAAKASAS